VPQGEFINVDGLDLYVAGAGNSKAVIWSHDIYGWKEGRTMELVDRLAADTEYTVGSELRSQRAKAIDLGGVAQLLQGRHLAGRRVLQLGGRGQSACKKTLAFLSLSIRQEYRRFSASSQWLFWLAQTRSHARA